METSIFKSVMSIDVEDAINVSMLRYFNDEIPPTYKAEENTVRLLDLFLEKNIKATFFVLGEIAETYPKLIKRIANEGHEIGIHGYKHRHLNTISYEKAREEIILAKKIVEDISGKQVYGFRAPFLSVNEKSIWILGILEELGFKYDSSIVNDFLPNYFDTTGNDLLTQIKLLNGKNFIEIPPTSESFFGRKIPVCGGVYLRLFPFRYIKYFVKKTLKKQPVIIYIHPYEIDSSLPPKFYKNKIKSANIKTKLAIKFSRYNRSRLVSRLEYLLDNYQFTTMINLLEEYEGKSIVSSKLNTLKVVSSHNTTPLKNTII